MAPVVDDTGRDVELRGQHAGRLEHVPSEVLLEPLAGGGLHDPVLEVVRVRRVHPRGAGLEQEGVVAPHPGGFLEVVEVAEAEEAVLPELARAIVPRAGAVREDVADGDGPLLLRIVGEVGLEGRVQVDEPPLHQLHQPDDRDHLRDRAHVVDRPSGGRDQVVELRVADALREDDLALDRHGDRETGQIVVGPDLLHVVEELLPADALAGQPRGDGQNERAPHPQGQRHPPGRDRLRHLTPPRRRRCGRRPPPPL